MRNHIALASLLILMFAFTAFGQATDEAVEMEGIRDGLLIHISHFEEDTHRVLMPLALALRMSQAVDVRVFLDIEAGRLVTKDAPNLTHEGYDMGSRDIITKLLEAGVSIHVCPMCMKVAGIEKEDLLDGIVVANPDTFHGFTEGRIVTLDY